MFSINSRCLARATVCAQSAPRLCSNLSSKARSQTRVAIHPYRQRRQQHFYRSIAAVTTLGATASAISWYSVGEVHAEEKETEHAELEFEQPRRKALSAEDNRELLSSQHLQVKKSWENPGVYAWGSNVGKVAAPDSNEKYIKTPRRLSFLDGVLLRDIKLDRNFAAAIDEKGDLLQWGIDFSKTAKEPTRTLKGKNLVSCALSRDRIIALSSSGTVYSVPVSQEEQKNGPKPSESSWLPILSSTSDISYRTHTPSDLIFNEKVTAISSGLEHALIRTSTGRVFSFASGSQDFPKRGQLGIPGLTWDTRPAGPFDVPHEITALKGFSISKIATGDHHSLVSDSAGRCFAFGDNASGQLGFDFSLDKLHVEAPALIPTQRLYSGSEASVTNVFAGGNTSFVTIDAVKPSSSAPTGSRTISDVWAFGFGLTGQLGTGRWIHNQNTPIKVPALSGLFEYDEASSSVVPIKLAYISAGATHAAAVMDNLAHVDIANKQSENEMNFGRDVMFWGNNEFYQIGTGKRNNISSPTYIQPLDQVAEEERAAGVLGLGKGVVVEKEKLGHRLQITPKKKVRVGGRTVNLEQRVECGRGVTAVYSGV